MKLCINCKHFNRGSRNCEHPKNQKVSLVSGLKVPIFLPAFLRDNQPLHVCGPNGNWFEERKEQTA